MSFFVNKKLYANYVPEINRFYKNRETFKKNLKRKWFPPAKGVELKQDPKGTEKIHKMNELDRKFCREIFEASKTKDSETALSAYHKLGYNKGDIRVYTALIKSLNTKNNLGESFEIYEDILKRKMKPNLITFDTLLDCCITNNHLERGIFVFNELKKNLSKLQYKKENEKLLTFFKKLLFLCFKNNSYSRSNLIFDFLFSKKLLSNEIEKFEFTFQTLNLFYSSTTTTTTNSTENKEEVVVDWKKEKEEREKEIKENVLFFLNEVKKIKNPNFKNEKFEEKKKFLNLEKMMKQSLKDIEPLNESFGMMNEDDVENEEGMIGSGSSMIGGFINPINFEKFPGKHENYEIEQFYNETWKNLFNITFNQPSIEFEMKKEKKENLYLYDKYASLMLNSMENLEDDEILEIKKNFKREQLQFNLKKSNLNWTPFIIGFDKKHFYPKGLDINVVNKERVMKAKEQYLNSIKDEEIKKEVQNDLNNMIKILWKDENGNILEGLEH